MREVLGKLLWAFALSCNVVLSYEAVLFARTEQADAIDGPLAHTDAVATLGIWLLLELVLMVLTAGLIVARRERSK